MVSLGNFYTLKAHKEFQYVYRKAKDAHSSSVVLFFLPSKNIRKIGFTATKKIGNAVKRNRAKRKLREQFLQHAPILQDGTYIFVAKIAINEIEHTKFQKDFQKILKKLHVLKENRDD